MTATTDVAGMLRAVLANPADDAKPCPLSSGDAVAIPSRPHAAVVADAVTGEAKLIQRAEFDARPSSVLRPKRGFRRNSLSADACRTQGASVVTPCATGPEFVSLFCDATDGANLRNVAFSHDVPFLIRGVRSGQGRRVVAHPFGPLSFYSIGARNVRA